MSTLLKVIIALVLAGFIGLILLGGAGVFYYLRSAGTVATVSPTPTPNPTPASTPTALASSTPDDTDDDSEDLEKEIAALQKKLEEMVNAAPGKQSTDDGTAKAIVNSPNDGFLALRDAPAEAGNRLAKIPHGTIVNLENCEKDKVRISGRSGRWCMVKYQDETGWVFDAWLVY